MSALSGMVILVLTLVLSLFIIVWPVQWAARAMGAKRTGFGWCLLALICANLLQALGSTVPVAGNLVAFLLGALAFAALLETSFLRGLGIALLHILFLIALLVGLAFLLGGGAALFGGLL